MLALLGEEADAGLDRVVRRAERPASARPCRCCRHRRAGRRRWRGRGGGSSPCWRVRAISARDATARSRSSKRPALSRVSATRPERTWAKSACSRRKRRPERPTLMVRPPVCRPRARSGTVITDRMSRVRRNSRSSSSWASRASSSSVIFSMKRGSTGSLCTLVIFSGSDGVRSAIRRSATSPEPGASSIAIRSTFPGRIRSIAQMSATSGTMTLQTRLSVSASVPPSSETSAIRTRTRKRRIDSLIRSSALAKRALAVARATPKTRMMTPSIPLTPPSVQIPLLKKGYLA